MIAEEVRRLEYAERDCSMHERLQRAAKRMLQCDSDAVTRLSLRSEQIGVFSDFAQFLAEASTYTTHQGIPYPSGRIILPPRTGKTVIAGQIIAASGLMTTFIVPSKTLVQQTARSLREQLIGIPVGEFYGERKELQMWGVNVTTYSILQAYRRRNKQLPTELAQAALIFADEGHHSITAERQKILSEDFHLEAIRVALTATANYNEKRRLATYYTKLIHEISITEAVELELVSPVRVWVAAVDVEGSTVQMRGGDYDEQKLGTIMGRAPFFEAARVFRYDEDQRDKAALICCVTQNQARDLYRYLHKRRPKDAPAPALLLGSTTGEERQTILDQFESGEIDTIINVGVLIEGWNSPRCKLLIDLAPSCSWVRATQKFFRPMTKWEDREASIFMIIPKNLPVLPVIPTDLFEWNMPQFEQGVFIGSKQQRQERRQKPHGWSGVDSIRRVQAQTEILLNVSFEKPKLNPYDDAQIRRVLASSSEVRNRAIPRFAAFRKLIFHHQLFTGRGENLLRFCKVPVNRFAYTEFMARFFPEAASSLYLGNRDYNLGYEKVADLKDHGFAFLEEVCAQKCGSNGDEPLDYGECVRALRYNDGDGALDRVVMRSQLREMLEDLLKTLSYRHQQVLKMRFGLFDYAERTLDDVGHFFHLSRESARKMEVGALDKMKHPVRMKKLAGFWMALNTWHARHF